MRKTVILLFLIVFPSLSFAQPEIKFDAETFDLGEVQEQSVSHSFEFKNTGTQELIINNIAPSCGCTAILVSSTKIKPGETGKIKASVNLRGMSGKNTKAIRISTNDPVKPEITLFLTFTAKSKSK